MGRFHGPSHVLWFVTVYSKDDVMRLTRGVSSSLSSSLLNSPSFCTAALGGEGAGDGSLFTGAGDGVSRLNGTGDTSRFISGAGLGLGAGEGAAGAGDDSALTGVGGGSCLTFTSSLGFSFRSAG